MLHMTVTIISDNFPKHNQTNLMHYLSSVYCVTILLRVSGSLVAHQDVTMYICNNWHVMYALVDSQLAWLEWTFHSNQAS
jgi:hypothetical protein